MQPSPPAHYKAHPPTPTSPTPTFPAQPLSSLPVHEDVFVSMKAASRFSASHRYASIAAQAHITEPVHRSVWCSGVARRIATKSCVMLLIERLMPRALLQVTAATRFCVMLKPHELMRQVGPQK